jgi:hypothetical protein
MLTYLFYPLSKPVSPGIKDCKNTIFSGISGELLILFSAGSMEQGAWGRGQGLPTETEH